MKKPIKPSKLKVLKQLQEDLACHNCNNRDPKDLIYVPDKKNLADHDCKSCNGKGWVYVPDQQPCPVEGRKMWDKMACPICFAVRPLLKKTISDVAENKYNEQLEAYNKELKEWNIAQSILKKCSPAEKKVAKKWFNITE